MRFIVRCNVEADVILPRRLELRKDGRIFELEVGPGDLWKVLRVTAPVRYPKRFRWGMEPIPEPRPANADPSRIHCTFDKDLFDSVIADIQALESTLSLFFPVRRIDWRHPILNVEFEPNDRRDPTWGNLKDFQIKPSLLPSVTADENLLVQIAFKGLASPHLATIESFWREGENEVLAGRFINAFYNFYFVLEGLYGDGHWKKDKLETAFKASTELKRSIDEYFEARQPKKHVKQIHQMLPEQKKEGLLTHEILIELVIRTRNKLHHFSNDPKKPHGSPLNHELYEGISMLVRFLSHNGLMKKALEIVGVAGRPVEA